MPHWAFGELKDGGIRICKCGEVTLEDEMHVCTLGEDMEPDPITEIQQTQDFIDVGKSAYLMRKGAMEAGASDFEAHMILVAWFSGMTSKIEKDEEDNEHSD